MGVEGVKNSGRNREQNVVFSRSFELFILEKAEVRRVEEEIKQVEFFFLIFIFFTHSHTVFYFYKR